MSIGPVQQLINKRARQAGTDPSTYLNWLTERVGELGNLILAEIEKTTKIPEGQLAQMVMEDNRTSETHVVTVTVTRKPVEAGIIIPN